MRQIINYFSVTFSVSIGIVGIVLGPAALLGILAQLLNLPELVSVALVLCAFAASIATVLSEPFISYLERCASKILFCRNTEVRLP